MSEATDSAAIRAFWRRVAPDFGLPAPPEIGLSALKSSAATGVYRLKAGEVEAVVRWRRGSLLLCRLVCCPR